MNKRKIETKEAQAFAHTVESIISNEAVGFMWLMLCAYIVMMACVGVWYRFDAIKTAVGL